MIKPLLNFYSSSIGKKWIVALTGLVLVAYVFGHLAGNLQVFLGANQLNSYAALLHSTGPLLWVVRVFLLAAFVLHIVATIHLAVQNRLARPQKYAVKQHKRSTIASRTMALSGLTVLSFVIYHLLHFTVRTVPPDFAYYVDVQGRHDTYRMVVEGFQNYWATGFYVLGVGLLCLHLSHGFASLLQTFGITNKSIMTALVVGARVLALGVFLGYISIPAAVVAGLGSDYVKEAKADASRMKLHAAH